jgi:hypothetical protein
VPAAGVKQAGARGGGEARERGGVGEAVLCWDLDRDSGG